MRGFLGSPLEILQLRLFDQFILTWKSQETWVEISGSRILSKDSGEVREAGMREVGPSLESQLLHVAM